MYSDPANNGSANESYLDIDAMLFDVSNRMARAQLARQISNSSSTFKRRAARVFKSNSGSNSPQDVQRRRTTSSHKSARQRSELHSQEVAMSHQGHGGFNQGRIVPVNRPMSWHPSSMASNRPVARTSGYYTPSRHSMAALETPNATNDQATVSQPAAHPDMDSAMSINPYSSFDGSSMSYQPSAMGLYENHPVGLDLAATYRSCLGYDATDQFQQPNMSMSGDYSDFSPVAYSTQTWAESLSAFPSYTNPPTPDFLPIQHPSDLWQGYMSSSSPPIPKKPSKELVGMGLYDNPSKESFALDAVMGGHLGGLTNYHPQPESTGKGLKLEETWQPPEDEEGSEAGDEEVDKETCPVVPADNKVPTGFKDVGVEGVPFSTYRDLSNQSFFFDSDEVYLDGTGFNSTIPTMAPNLHGYALPDFGWV